MAELLSDADVRRIAKALADEMRATGPSVTRDEMSNIAVAAARTTAQEMSVKAAAMLGIDLANAKHIEALKMNLDFIQRLRLRSESVGQSMSNAIANAFALGLIALLAIGFIVWVRGWNLPTGHPPVITK